MNKYCNIKQLDAYKELIECFSEAQIQRGINHYIGATNSEDEALKEMKRVMDKNPYDLVAIPYITIRYIDGIVTHLPNTHPWHIGYDDPRRFRAMLQAALRQYIRKGAAVVGKQRIIDLAMKSFSANTPDKLITPELHHKVQNWLETSYIYDELDLVINQETHHGIISTQYKQLTKSLAKKLIKIARRPQIDLDESIFTDSVLSVDQRDGTHIELSADQQDAAHNLLSKPISVLTGYAGVGKSTLIQAVTNYIRQTGQKVQLCAHAGKAAFNLEQTTGVSARTIASILYSHARMDVDYLIIDEISMVSEESLFKLLSLITSKTKVILLGDRAQLPAVEGVGVMTSLPKFLDSHDLIYTKNLTHVYRQADRSQLLQVATQIRNREVPQDLTSHDGTIMYHQGSREFVVYNYLAAVKKYGMDNVNVITPLNQDVTWFNQELQKQSAGNKPTVEILGRTFHIDDKVLVTKNMYNIKCATNNSSYVHDTKIIDLFNGFVGKVVGISNNSIRPSIRVRFNNIKTGEPFTDVDFFATATEDGSLPKRKQPRNAEISNLELGYALTVHKSQGSTIGIVLYYLDAGTPPTMLTNELLYTALTRAKSRLLFVTNQPLMPQMLSPFINTTAYSVKTSYLADALEEEYHKSDEENNALIDPFDDKDDFPYDEDDLPY